MAPCGCTPQAERLMVPGYPKRECNSKKKNKCNMGNKLFGGGNGGGENEREHQHMGDDIIYLGLFLVFSKNFLP